MSNHLKVKELVSNITKYLIGKKDAAELSIITLLAGGHLLIEDVPGVGKTTLANLLARSSGCGFTRIQFTPDTLPGDITGASVFNMKTGDFKFVPGAIMNNIVLVDEVNRTSPKTQAALLEAMQERQVTVDGVTYKLEEPFMVIATQNPIEFIGTYNLPEAQLDRFLMKIKIGYPDLDEEQTMSRRFIDGVRSEEAQAVVTSGELIEIRNEVKKVSVSESAAGYIISLTASTRENKSLSLGASPRATLALISASQACAYLNGRDYVIPDDIQRVLTHVLCHRIVLTLEARMNNILPEKIIESIVNRIRVPV